MKLSGTLLLGLLSILSGVRSAACQNEPVLPLRFIYLAPQSNNGFYGCGSLIGVDVSVQNCTTFSPTSTEFVWSLEFQPLPALKLGRVEIPIVPEVSIQYVVPDFDHMHFRDRVDEFFAATNQASLRLAIGYDTYFYDRHLWGERTLLKVGGACLLTRALDLNPRREGCDDLDLDNWFIRGTFARTIHVRNEDSDREIGYLEATVYHEIPDHDFASKTDPSGSVEVFNDDGLDVTFADVRFLARIPAVRHGASDWGVDLRLGGGVGVAHQIETATAAHGALHLTLTRRNLSITGAARYTARNGSYNGLDEDRYYWTAQAYVQWRPDLVVFWDHRY